MISKEKRYKSKIFEKRIIEFAKKWKWENYNPEYFKVNRFCKFFHLSRSSYYKYIVPNLKDINNVRKRRCLAIIPNPGKFDRKRFLRNSGKL